MHEQLKAKAGALDLPLSTFLVRLATGVALPRPVPPVNRSVFRELCRIGTNINQLAHAANSGTPVGVNPRDLVALAQIIRRFKEDLLGKSSEPSIDAGTDR